MKKLFPALLAIMVLAAASLTAFASGNSKNAGENTEIDVIGKYVEGNAATLISVDISWDDMSFTYNDGERTWDPDKHEYITSDGSWTNEKKTISVRNHSNTAVRAEFSFTSSLDGIGGSFGSKTLKLETAVGKAVEAAPAASTDFTVSGGKISADAKLGTITVNISADTSVDAEPEQNASDIVLQSDGITTYNQLAEALKNGGDITLGSDIAISDAIAINGSATIDLNKHTLTGNGATMFTVNNGSFTLTNGNIEPNGGQCVAANGAEKVKFSGCKANIGSGLLCSGIDSTIVLETCEIRGGGTLVELSSASTLEFLKRNIFIGKVSQEYGCDIKFSNASGSIFGFNPSSYADDLDIEENADGTWTVGPT